MDAKKRSKKDTSAPHLFLVMMRSIHAIIRRADIELQQCGLTTTDFRLLEALLHKGPLPVNVLGPKVRLTAGAISVAVDRLLERGLVTRVEGERDRRIRTVALTEEGESVIRPVYLRHSALLEKVFEPLNEAQREAMETMLKQIGRNADALSEMAFDGSTQVAGEQS